MNRPSKSVANDSAPIFRDILWPSVRAIRRNWAPMLLIQIIAVVLVICYFSSAGVRQVTSEVGRAKEAGGLAFVLLSGACSGSVIPQIAKILTGKSPRIDRDFWKDSFYAAFVFAIVALQVDIFYRYQTVWFGSGQDIATLTKKTAMDMFVACPTIFVPVAMLLLYVRQVQFRPRRVSEAVSWQFYRTRVIPTLPINWLFWIPILFCVYSLPSVLQFPFSQLAEACWSLVFIFIADDAMAASHGS